MKKGIAFYVCHFILTFVFAFTFYMFDFDVATAAEQSVVCEPSVEEPQPEDTVSTGQELTAWLDSHKNSGGTVRLADDMTLDGTYCFYPQNAGGPSLFVNTDRYTITVSGEIELMSDKHLTFSGQPDGKGIFYVAPNGMLSLQGVAVESGQGALWQEEGAGLAVSDCSVSGDIRYADTPFVLSCENSVCAIVEKGQTLDDVLPSQIGCEVIYQGGVKNNEPVSVTWNREGSEKQQAERRRFRMQGSFPDAASKRQPLCTVVYNDYPLTFTDVEATSKGSLYLFTGSFTMSGESRPDTVVSEYSFDGENWFSDEEQTADYAAFHVVCQCDQNDSDIYICLQGKNNETVYYSNVLRFSSGDLERAEDIGGSRGGGTSITNPPEGPQQSGDAVSPKGDAKPTESGTEKAGRDEADQPPQQAKTESVNTVEEPQQQAQTEPVHIAGEPQQQAQTEPVHIAEEPQQQAQTDPVNIDEAPQQQAASANADGEQPAEVSNTDQDLASAAALSEYHGKQETFSTVGERMLRSDSRTWKGILLAAGAVLLAAAAGIAGFYLHSRSGTKR